MHVCIYVRDRLGFSGLCTVTSKSHCASPSYSSLCKFYASDEVQDFPYGIFLVWEFSSFMNVIYFRSRCSLFVSLRWITLRYLIIGLLIGIISRKLDLIVIC
jgi:hypothetical protein